MCNCGVIPAICLYIEVQGLTNPFCASNGMPRAEFAYFCKIPLAIYPSVERNFIVFAKFRSQCLVVWMFFSIFVPKK